MLGRLVPDRKVCLAVESTADDYSVGIVTFDGEVLANVINSFIPETGGIHPREAARHHANVAGEVISTAFREACIKPDEISIIAFSQGPGLGPCLRTGATSARALSSYLDIPLVGVNHCVAHIEIGKLTTGAIDPVTLYVSGGNTIVSAFDAGRYRVFGETLDIAAGNCLDVFAREAGLRQSKGMPLGAIVEEQARKGRKLLDLPYSVKGMDLSFSGLLTAIVRLLKEGEHPIEDLCYNLEEMVFSMLAEVTERALAHTEKSEILLTGGVGANKRLQEILNSVAADHNSRFCAVPKQYALDNGAMIAWTGILAYKHGLITPIEKSFVRLKWRLEDVDAPWVGE
ncbi:MAG: KEOPS complex N(6)-L-threonylcarbamoyladenine synthase Kae1 [Candidatus Bathyarchaeota archaeon]|nr:KEOPS complex N(6)-L-threonylcarbamoyladenine synthase Kae1 [Candidatus Bathyarchaeota archaeon]